MALVEKLRPLRLQTLGVRKNRSAIPLAWRNFIANGRRLVRSLAGIAFAALLMLVELGLNAGFLATNLLPIRQLDGDIILLGSTKYEFDRPAPFSRRQLHEARSVPGVASVRPFYVQKGIWKNPQNQRLFPVQVFAFDPDQPVFLIPEINAKLEALRRPDTVMVDRRARAQLGEAVEGTETELSRRKITVVGTFWLGPNFFSDGNLVMGDYTFFKFFGRGSELPNVDAGIVKVLPGYAVSDVQQALKSAMPTNVTTLTKSELLDREAQFHSEATAVGPIFGIGTLVGFAVGMLISYQILFSELSDQLPQYATLKAMGYQNSYLLKVVLQQAMLYGLFGYLMAWVLSYLVFQIIGDLALMPMRMSASLTAISLGLTLVMCISSALIALRRVIAVDPAELFR